MGGDTAVLVLLVSSHFRVFIAQVMGGQSKSALKIEDGVAKFTGLCAIVPFLKAPGFITMETGGFFSFHKEVFPDINSCDALSFVLKTNVDYKGYRISFGKEHVKGGRHASGYKAGPLLDLPSKEFGEIVIPLNEFSSKWDEATGDITVSCKEDPQYCPSEKWLSNMETISFWGEGVEGEVDLEIQKITAVGCSSTNPLNLSANLVPNPHQFPMESILFLLGLVAVVAALAAYQKRSSRLIYEEIPEQVRVV